MYKKTRPGQIPSVNKKNHRRKDQKATVKEKMGEDVSRLKKNLSSEIKGVHQSKLMKK